MLAKVAATIIVLLIIVMPVFAEYSDPVRPQIPEIPSIIQNKGSVWVSREYKEMYLYTDVREFSVSLFDNYSMWWCQYRPDYYEALYTLDADYDFCMTNEAVDKGVRMIIARLYEQSRTSEYRLP